MTNILMKAHEKHVQIVGNSKIYWLKIVEIVIHCPFCAFLQAWFLVEKFSLKYFLKSRTFTENLFVNFYICHFHFLSFFFSLLVTGSLRGGGE